MYEFTASAPLTKSFNNKPLYRKGDQCKIITTNERDKRVTVKIGNKPPFQVPLNHIRRIK